MSVSAITANSNPPVYQNSMRQDLQALQKALNSGDLAGAQQAFATFKDDFHSTHQGRALFQTHVPVAIQQDLRGLQSALKAGDLAGAQQAFATFQQDMTQRLQHTEPPSVEPPQSTEGGSSPGVNVIA
ncbi:MAG: hypothetical protein LAN63_17635 [Acidobacteriia bacterium]|nr:hypothetical protein [Terriglobia bacterium]